MAEAIRLGEAGVTPRAACAGMGLKAEKMVSNHFWAPSKMRLNGEISKHDVHVNITLGSVKIGFFYMFPTRLSSDSRPYAPPSAA